MIVTKEVETRQQGGGTMSRRKKTWMLLRGRMGTFIVVTRAWYDSKKLGRRRGRNQMWLIAAEGNDFRILQAMGQLTDRYVGQEIKIEHVLEEKNSA